MEKIESIPLLVLTRNDVREYLKLNGTIEATEENINTIMTEVKERFEELGENIGTKMEEIDDAIRLAGMKSEE